MEQWTESDSEVFIKYGRCFVPEREKQIEIICDLIPTVSSTNPKIVDLCCGQGLLTEALLNQIPEAEVVAMDVSPTMLQEVKTRLSPFKTRLQVKEFDLPSANWRHFDEPIHAFVSSLAIHHLDAEQKQTLFSDVNKMLAPGGAFIIADLIMPLQKKSQKVAAKGWDEATHERSLKFEGDLKAYDIFQRLNWNYFYTLEDPIDKPSPIFDQLKWFEAAGFEGVEVFWLKAGHAVYGGYKKNNSHS